MAEEGQEVGPKWEVGEEIDVEAAAALLAVVPAV